MSIDRDHVESPYGESSEPVAKRQKKQNKTRQHQNSGIDSTWGQKYVFSDIGQATTIPEGEESEYEDDSDAMAYLTLVRKEALGIPHLLVAPKRQIGPQLPTHMQQPEEDEQDEGEVTDDEFDRTIYEDGVGDSRGWYEDGAYIARPDEAEDVASPEDDDGSESDQPTSKAIQQAYFTSILEDYRRLRRALQSCPPEAAASSLTPNHPTFADLFGPSSTTKTVWSRLLRTTDPHPVQMALMDKDSVLRIIRILSEKNFLAPGFPTTERTSRWIYALLARLPDQWELTHVEIGWLRDLGKQAVLLGMSVSEMAALRETVEEGALGIREDDERSSVEQERSTDEGLHVEDDHVMAGISDAESEIATETADDDEAGETWGEDMDERGDDEGVPMELASPSSQNEHHSDLQEVKSRLLAQLDKDEDDVDAAMSTATERARRNAQATFTIILTIVGEFYGQRDLLEFRKPFVDL